MSAQTQSLTFREFAATDAPELAALINGAFAVDHFFKYPEFYDRVNVDLLQSALQDKNLLYWLGFIPDDEFTQPSLCSCVLISAYVEIIPSGEDVQPTVVPYLTFTQNPNSIDVLKNLQDAPKPFSVRLISSISQVSVDPGKQGRGLGKHLIRGTEQHLSESINTQRLTEINQVLKLTNLQSHCQSISHIAQLEVLVAVRPELLPFYSKLGYIVTKEGVPFSAQHICLPEYSFTSTTMEKVISTNTNPPS